MTTTPATEPAAFDKNALTALENKKSDLQDRITDAQEKLAAIADGERGETFDANSYAIDSKQLVADRAALDVVKEQIADMNLRNPEVIIDKNDPNKATDARQLLDMYLRAGSNEKATGREAADLLASADFTDFARDGGVMLPLHDAIATDTSSASSTVNEPTEDYVVDRLKYAGAVGMAFQQMSTAKGGDIKIPRIDNVSDEGEVVGAQNSAINTADFANDFGNATLEENTISSKFVKLARRAARDPAFDMVNYSERTVQRRIARTMNKVMTNGQSGSKFHGVKAVAKDGVTTADRNTLTWRNLISGKFAIDEAYRAGNEGFGDMGGGFMDFQKGQGAVGWMFHVDVVEHLHGLVDNDGRPLWAPNTREGMPDMLAGFPIFINNDLDAFGASAVVGLFGNYGHMVKRDIGGLMLFNFQDATTMNNDQIWILGLWDCDSTLVGPESASGVADGIAKVTLGA